MPDESAFFDQPWWEEKSGDKALNPLLGLYKHFVNEDSNRLAAYDAYSRVYMNRDITDSDYLASYRAAWAVEDNAYSRVPVNLAKTMVDSAVARITRQNPRPVFVTKGGNWSLHKKAQQMQRWVEYCEHFSDLRPVKKQVWADGHLYGDGFLKTSAHPVVDTVVNDRVHPSDIFVDPVEAAVSGKPTHLYQRSFVNRSRLAKFFENTRGAKTAIRNAERITEGSYVWHRERRTMRNMVEVVEAWKLPSYDDAGDGRHAIAINGFMVVYEEYDGCAFPFSHAQWKRDPTIGFWGISQVEELLGLHYDFNLTIKKVEECIENMPTPIILIPEGGNISTGKLANVNGITITYADRPPTFQLPPSVPPDVFNYANSIWQKALEISGLISMTLPDKTGNGFETGAAVRDFNDIQATELAQQYESFERFNVHTYENQVRAGRAIYKRNPAFKTVARRDKYTIEDVEWKDIDDPREDSFIIQVFPASMLSQLPAGRKSDVLDYYNAGWLDVGEAMDLLDFPDLDHFRDLRTAARKNVERILENILDEGKYTAPEPTLDLRLSLKITQMYINKAQAMGVPEQRISMLRQFARQVHRLIQESDQEAQSQQAGNGFGAAGGPPVPSPTDGQMPTAI